MSRALTVLLLLGLAACTHTTIPNTDVEDTPDSREVVNFVESYRQAVVSRDISKLIGLVAEDYYDDMGTPQGDDDVDREVLRERLESTFGPELLAVHYDIRYRDVVFLPTKVLVDYTYIGRFRVNTPDGSRWERRLADNRMVLAKKKDGTYTIMSGM
ncbi:MAG TPA: hypothetical protein VFX59_26355 [Polyangiales bacterium]|nr:hypothetical protein [Polyangiales bacterium]